MRNRSGLESPMTEPRIITEARERAIAEYWRDRHVNAQPMDFDFFCNRWLLHLAASRVSAEKLAILKRMVERQGDNPALTEVLCRIRS